jgi:hypothetical protein
MEHRSYGVLFAAFLVACSAIGFALLTAHVTTPEVSSDPETLVATTPTKAALDSDGDGVPDWQEVLWRTDPNNPDTDGNGISDAEEIASGTLASSLGSGGLRNPYIAPRALPTTEAVAREFFANYVQAHEQGVLNEQVFEGALSDTLDRHVTITSRTTQYTLADIAISRDKTVAAYQSDLEKILLPVFGIEEYELITFSRAVEDGEKAALTRLAGNAAVYRDVARRLRALETPEAIALSHLDVVNAFGMITDATAQLAEWQGDPLHALSAVAYFNESETILTDSLSELFTLIANFLT